MIARAYGGPLMLWFRVNFFPQREGGMGLVERDGETREKRENMHGSILVQKKSNE